jgi:hypothetical protein
MKRILLVLFATLVLALGLSSSASAAAPNNPANPVGSCSGVTASSFAGEPGGEASDRGDGRDEAGIPPGALFSTFSRLHEGTVVDCQNALPD